VFTFGEIEAYQGDVSFQAGLSDDRRAVTLTFSDVTAEVGKSPNDPAPTANRSLSLVLPIEGGAGTAEIEFTLQAGIVLTADAHATAVLSVNGQSEVSDFLVEPQETFVQRLLFAADTPAECRLFALLLVGRDSRFPGAAAVANVVSIDAELLPRRAQPAEPGP
jgi:hypothetical protein